MKKWLFLIAAFLITFTDHPIQSSAATAAAPKTYPVPVKVDITPAGNFTVTTHGNYQLVNLDNNQTLNISGPISMNLQPSSDGKYHISEVGKDYSSSKGWALQELPGADSYFTLTSGGNTVSYWGTLTLSSGKVFNTLEMENYLKGVVPCEMPASWGLEALKAQAVVARNYAYNSMKTTGFLYDDTRSQVYGGKSREDSRTNIAVSETKGIVMYNGTTIVGGYFSSSNGGHTAQGSEVWSNDLPYLKSVADPYDSYNNPNSHWSTKIANDTISAKLGLTGYSKIVSLKVTKATAYGRAQQVTAVALDPTTGNTKSYTLPSGSPDGLRSAFGVSLKSTMFTITPQNTSAQIMMADGTVITVDYLYGSPIKTATDSTVNLLGNIVSVQDADKTYNQNLYPLEFTFNGSGYGHGLGLSQYGANGMAAKGFGYKDILKFYFNNITFKTIE